MSYSQRLLLGAVLLCGSVLALAAEQEPAAPATAVVEQQHFLTADEMQKMQEYKPKEGTTVKRWLSEKLTSANYLHLMIDPVVYHPAAAPNEQVTQATLDEIASFLTDKEREMLGGKLTIVTAAAPGTMRLSTAITGVTVATEGMKPYEVLPIAAVFGMAKAASGNRKQDVRLYIETRMVDAVSGELLGVTMREVKGKDLKNKKATLTLKDVSPALTDALKAGLNTLSERGY